MTIQTGDAIPRPWIDHYPPGIRWDIAVNTTPVHEQVLAMCQKTPSAIALDFLGAETRYSALGKAISAFAAALQTEYGVRKGTRVALMLPNTPFYAVAYYAVLRAGGTVVNCNPLYTQPELTHIIGNSGADLLVTLDLKQLFSKAEALVEAGHVQKLVVCEFATALPMVKGVLFRIAKAKDIADVQRLRARRRAGQLLPRPRPPRRHACPGRHQPAQGRCGAAIYRRHHRQAERRDAEPRQHRRAGVAGERVGPRPIRRSLQGRGGAAVLPHLLDDRLPQPAALQRRRNGDAAALRAQGPA